MNSNDESPKGLEALLRAHAREGLDGGPPQGPHIDDGALAQLAEGRARPTAAQRRHLSECAACRDVLGAAASAVPEAAAPPRRRFDWRFAFAPGLLAAAAGIAIFVLPGDRPDGYARRGGEARYEEASVSVLRIGDGRREVLGDHARVPLSARLGFRYGNPAGEARTLTVIGYDGAQIRWYYPEGPGEPGFSIQGGAAAVSRRLPFDIRLAERHQAGPLHVWAAFDVEPEAFAAQVRAGGSPKAALHLELVLE